MKSKDKTKCLREVYDLLKGSIMVCFVFLIGCTNSPFDISDNSSNEILDPTISVQISYNQKSAVYTPFWPDDIVAGTKGKQISGDVELLIDYDNTSEKIIIDKDRFMTFEVEYIEGTRSQAMPDDLYNDVQMEMPNRETNKDVIKIITDKDGIHYFYKDGSQETVTQEETDMRLDEETYEYWLQLASNDTDTTTSSRIARNLQMLEESGVNFNLLGSSTAYFEIQPTIDDPKTGLIRQKMDLKTGQIIMSSTQLPDGRYESVELMNYKVESNIPVMANSETYVFSSIQGEWQATQKHVVNRENIKVIRNF